MVILYEDAPGPRKGFGPHELVVRCVADDYLAPQNIGGSAEFALQRQLDGRPMKGVDKVLAACKRIEQILIGDQTLFLLLDDDQIRRHVGLPAASGYAEVEAAIRKLCPLPDRLHITLLAENAETLIRAAADCDPSIDRGRVDSALRKKVLERDLVFQKVAWAGRAVRDCVRKKVPSFDGFIRALITKLPRVEQW